jgi:Protein of unknown function (DUF2971)
MLYKYLRPERVDVLRKLEIRFTQPDALNDPFELRPRFESLISEVEALAICSATPIDFDPILRQAYSMLPEQQRSLLGYEDAAASFKSFMETDQGRSAVSAGLLWFLRFNRQAAAPLRESLYEALNRGVGILSLTEVPDEPLMWAHYAESHRGILLGFDEEHAFFNRRRSENDEFYLRKVIYADLPPTPTALAVDGNALLVTKGTKWSYEREWRMFAPLEDASRAIEVVGDSVHLFSLPAEALVSAVIGARASAELEGAVRDAVHGSADLAHIAVSRAALDLAGQRVCVRGLQDEYRVKK